MERYFCQGWVALNIVLTVFGLACSNAAQLSKVPTTKTSVFLTPKLELAPGDVKDRYYYNIDFPKGHIGIKSFNADVVDDQGNSVPLSETYLHHWMAIRYYGRIGWVEPDEVTQFVEVSNENFTIVRNAGVCPDVLRQYYGIGSETRRTNTHIPDPYAVEVGDPALVPDGFEEKWLLNVHAIDTRGAVDRFGCIECRRDLYNVTTDEYGKPLRQDYIGGCHICYDGTRCRVKDGFYGEKRNLYMRYTVEWLDWSDSLLPVRINILDTTDTVTMDSSTGAVQHDCRVEYNIVPSSNGVQTTTTIIEKGGYLVYGVAHQHAGGLGVTIYGEDGRVLCTSIPIYGTGTEAGNEEGYIVGMTTCYPKPGYIKINDGETIVVQSNYKGHQLNTGVMGQMYIMVADSLPNYSFA